MPYNPDGSFSLENEVGTGYACNNALVPLIGADLDDIAAALSQTSTVGVLSGVIAQSKNSTLLASVLPPATAVLVMQVGPCTLKANDLLQANAFVEVANNWFAQLDFLDELFITTTPASTAPAQNSDKIGGVTNTSNNRVTVESAFVDTLQAVGTATVSGSGAYYLNYVVTYDPSNTSTIAAGLGSLVCGINIIRYRMPLGTI